MKERLKCLSKSVAESLYDNIGENIQRYRVSGFEDLSQNYGWSVELQLTVDLDPLKDLNGGKGAELEIGNALLVWRALSSMPPSLACENRVWARLTHVEGFNYSKDRWLDTSSDDKLIKSAKVHFFALGRTQWRDDNAISRLWWIAYMASLVKGIEQKTVLDFILNRADTRSNFIERSWITVRPRLAAAIIRIMMIEDWLTASEGNFRVFMRQVNKFGGGILFESWSESELEEFMLSCAAHAKNY